MKRVGTMLVGLLLCLGAVASQVSADVLVLGDNQIYFSNFENLFDADGVLKDPTSTPEEGDYLAGIIKVQNIDSSGLTVWESSSTNQLTGVFAQEITAISFEGPIMHLTLGNPTEDTFTNGSGDTFITGLASGEMFRFYLQEGVGTTAFESNGTMLDDVTKATDGVLYLSYTVDGTGYMYSHPILGSNLTGEAWGALTLFTNNSGLLFNGVNDPTESEIGGATYLNDIVFSSEFHFNTNSTSPWKFESNDPAIVNVSPIPEVSSLWLLGMGFSGLGFASGIKKFRI